MPADKTRVKQARATARKMLIKDAVVHVRLDQALMKQLLDHADDAGVPVSVLVRNWIDEKLNTASDVENRLQNIEAEIARLKKRA